MARKSMQDIVPKRSIRNIEVREKPTPRKIVEEKEKEKDEPVVRTRAPRRKQKGDTAKALWVIAVTCATVLVVVVFSLFAEAKIKITPRQQAISIDNSYTARREAKDLSYEIMSVTKEGSESVDAESQVKTEAKATGKIIVYNNFGTTVQKLLKGTRFENTKGQIYRSTQDIYVPGKKTKDGKVIPGSVEASVVADAIGEEYNMKISDLGGDFKIPGYKGTEKYNGFFARLKTDIQGGASGAKNIVSEKNALPARKIIQERLKKEILEEASKLVPQGYLSFNNAYVIKFETLPYTNGANNKVVLKEKATLTSFIFKADQLARHIANQSAPTSLGADIEILGLKDFIFTSKIDPVKYVANQPIAFTLKGNGTVVWTFDQNALLQELYGKPVSELAKILTHYRMIVSADLQKRPIWMRTFPTKPEKIKIERVIK